MTEMIEVYRCEICGNIVEVVHTGKGQLVCCGQPMKLIKENTVDASKEKHVPVVILEQDRTVVKVGSVAHPMEEKHYIEWIEFVTDGNKIRRKHLRPGDKPEAEFCPVGKQKFEARAYCNLHGLWKSIEKVMK